MYKEIMKETLKECFISAVWVIWLLFYATVRLHKFLAETAKDCIYSAFWALSVISRIVLSLCEVGMERLDRKKVS